jgi:FAD:protein FMN transferase
MMDYQLQLTCYHHSCRILFPAMASPCEVLIDGNDPQLALQLGRLAQAEAQRIESCYSRYRDNSRVHAINSSAGVPLALDGETADLIDFAALLWEMSEGRFDITSGILRRVWRFDGGDQLPDPYAIERLLPLIGWQHVTWQRPWLTLPEGMEIDLGGIGKEYAVDRVAGLLATHLQAAGLSSSDKPHSFLVNFGGDLFVSGPRANGEAWQVGIEAIQDDPAARVISLSRGGLATSGDARRFLQVNGIRYSHILDPRSGWPVVNAPASVTVAAPSCVQAGMLATLASLQGDAADDFLQEQQVPYWISRR